MHSRSHYRAFLLVIFSLLAGCAALTPEFDPPKISLVSFRSVPSVGGAPKFEITLKVLNPNKEPLDIAGISYSIALLDREVITGVANDIPPIAGYGEGEVTLQAGLQLLELLRLLASLGTTDTEPLEYRFSAKIDFTGFMPTQRIVESGEINLR
ncbi:MAG: LEA type 2 family protein [Halioglobus sp.]